jgi:hypothetical protein
VAPSPVKNVLAGLSASCGYVAKRSNARLSTHLVSLPRHFIVANCDQRAVLDRDSKYFDLSFHRERVDIGRLSLADSEMESDSLLGGAFYNFECFRGDVTVMSICIFSPRIDMCIFSKDRLRLASLEALEESL